MEIRRYHGDWGKKNKHKKFYPIVRTSSQGSRYLDEVEAILYYFFKPLPSVLELSMYSKPEEQ